VLKAKDSGTSTLAKTPTKAWQERHYWVEDGNASSVSSVDEGKARRRLRIEVYQGSPVDSAHGIPPAPRLPLIFKRI
jgi:hypothetical protein